MKITFKGRPGLVPKLQGIWMYLAAVKLLFLSMSNSLHKDTILQKLSDRKRELSEFGVRQIGLFGSFLRSENTPDSDIDLLVDLRLDYKTFKNFMALNYYLEDLLGCKVELVTKQSLSPYLGPHILKTVEYASIAS